MTRIRIPPPSSGGVMLSYKCTATCRHCMYLCSPKWDADWIREDDLITGLRQLARTILPGPWGPDSIGVSHGLHFSGGEPFLNFPLLLRSVEIAEGFSIPSTFVETNCFWCRDDETAREKLHLLRSAGLRGIMISVNPYYAEFVPFERTKRCIRLSLEVFGLNVIVYQQEFYRLFRQLGIQGKITPQEFLMLAGEPSLASRVEMFLMGRATRSLRDLYLLRPAAAYFSQPCQPAFLRDWHNHFDNYGNFMPGFCGGLSLGNWFELDHLLAEGIELDDLPVLGYLISGDMRGLFHFAGTLGYSELEDGYVSKCDLCLDIRKHLASVGDFAELKPSQFYANLD